MSAMISVQANILARCGNRDILILLHECTGGGKTDAPVKPGDCSKRSLGFAATTSFPSANYIGLTNGCSACALYGNVYYCQSINLRQSCFASTSYLVIINTTSKAKRFNVLYPKLITKNPPRLSRGGYAEERLSTTSQDSRAISFQDAGAAACGAPQPRSGGCAHE